ncbi:MAG: hypothetical protein ACSLFR_09855 [Solirubrobacteraceae bacterium]
MPSTADLTPTANSAASPHKAATETHHSAGGEVLPPDMRATVGRRMSRMVVVSTLIVGVLALPGAAGAQEGNGPYAPFPSVSDNAPGDAWYALMNAEISSAQLADGAFAGELRPLAAGAPTGASARAGVGVAGTGPAALLAALGLAVFATGAVLVLRRREGVA